MFKLLIADEPIPQDYIYINQTLSPPTPDGRQAFRLTGDFTAFEFIRTENKLSYRTSFGVIGLIVGGLLGGYVAALVTALVFGIRRHCFYVYGCTLNGNISFIALSDESTYKEIYKLYEESVSV